MGAAVGEAGSFGELPFSHLLIRALDERWTGMLSIEAPSCEPHRIQVRKGLVARVLPAEPAALLGELLVDAGVLMASELELGLEEPGPLGEALLQRGVIEQGTLQRALVLQLLRRLEPLFGLSPHTSWRFSDDSSDFDGMPEPVRIDTLRVLWSGLSTHGEMGDAMKTTLRRVGEIPFQVRPEVKLSRFGFANEAALVVGFLRGERLTLRELIAHALADEALCCKIVYLLTITRYLDFSQAEVEQRITPVSQPPSGPTSSRALARIKLRKLAVHRGAAPDEPGSGEVTVPSSSDQGSPVGSSSAPTSSGPIEKEPLPAVRIAQLDRIRKRHARVGSDTPYEALEISPSMLDGKSEDAITDVLWEVYEARSRDWHPDSCLPAYEGERAAYEAIYDAITEAFVTLADPRKRSDYQQATEPATAKVSYEETLNSAMPASVLDAVSEEPTSAPALATPEPVTPEPVTPEPVTREPVTREPVTPEPVVREAAADELREKGMSPKQLHELALGELAATHLTKAKRLCDLACDGAPDNPDFAATSVWIRAAMPKPDLKVLTLDLDDILRGHQEHVSARYYRGVLRRRLGYDSAAKQDFEGVLRIVPDHRAAKSQLSDLAQHRKR